MKGAKSVKQINDKLIRLIKRAKTVNNIISDGWYIIEWNIK